MSRMYQILKDQDTCYRRVSEAILGIHKPVERQGLTKPKGRVMHDQTMALCMETHTASDGKTYPHTLLRSGAQSTKLAKKL